MWLFIAAIAALSSSLTSFRSFEWGVTVNLPNGRSHRDHDCHQEASRPGPLEKRIESAPTLWAGALLVCLCQLVALGLGVGAVDGSLKTFSALSSGSASDSEYVAVRWFVSL